MIYQVRLAAVLLATALVTAGCLDFGMPPVDGPEPTRTPTATFTPEPTATAPTPTTTSTSTPTLTPTVTPFAFNPFASPQPGSGTALATPIPGTIGSLPTATATSGLGGGLLPINSGTGTFLPPLPTGASAPPTQALATPLLPIGGVPSVTTGGAPAPGTGVTLPPTTGGAPSNGAAPGAGTLPVAPPEKTATPISWNCNGDERLEFVPEGPIIGDEVLITVTSAKPLGYTLLVGPSAIERLGEGRGGPGYYWQWKRRMDKAGSFGFDFFAGPRKDSRCISATLRVGAVGAPPTPTTIPKVVPTPTPTRT
ncbi:MAG: hypothetical protein NTZ05_08175, partial [Chloroflexi bacterium]|nr:hypothetical protein [Chloroflexota bacterium]